MENGEWRMEEEEGVVMMMMMMMINDDDDDDGINLALLDSTSLESFLSNTIWVRHFVIDRSTTANNNRRYKS
jgi:hypothetical protein